MQKKNCHCIVLSALALLLTGGCITNDSLDRNLTGIQSIALCHNNEQSQQLKSKITAEHGFRRFAENTYRPVIKYQLFGHAVRVVEMEKDLNKIYVAGNPLEFGHHFNLITPNVTCEKNSCQAPLKGGRSLHIYKVQNKKSKDTTVIECSKITDG